MKRYADLLLDNKDLLQRLAVYERRGTPYGFKRSDLIEFALVLAEGRMAKVETAAVPLPLADKALDGLGRLLSFESAYRGDEAEIMDMAAKVVFHNGARINPAHAGRFMGERCIDSLDSALRLAAMDWAIVNKEIKK